MKSFSGTNPNTGTETKSSTTTADEKPKETPSAAAPKSEEKSSGGRSVIGEKIKFRGELVGSEDIHIEGEVKGTIIMEGHDLSVGSQGVIDANIHANNIAIDGKLTGDIFADELIAIKKTAIVKGNLIAPRIQLDDGGKFRGSMDMVDNDKEKTDKLTKFREKLVHPDLPKDNAADNRASSTSPSNNNDPKLGQKK